MKVIKSFLTISLAVAIPILLLIFSGMLMFGSADKPLAGSEAPPEVYDDRTDVNLAVRTEFEGDSLYELLENSVNGPNKYLHENTGGTEDVETPTPETPTPETPTPETPTPETPTPETPTPETPTPETPTPETPTPETPTPETPTPETPTPETPTPETPTPETPTPETPTPETPTPETPTPEEPKEPDVFYIKVYDNSLGKVVVMDIENYVLRALAAEMDVYSNEYEALKAQAVAIRSFILSKNRTGHSEHRGAQACTSPAHCMACVSASDYAKLPASQKALYERAARETKGQVVTYRGEIACTYFHDSSYGYTESVSEVFGGYAPYLVPVTCERNPSTIRTKTITLKNLLIKLLGSTEGAALYERLTPGEKGFSDVTETVGGRLKSVRICGVSATGAKIRSVMGFASTDIEIAYDPESEVFTLSAYGSGHGLGMSQMGAKALAREGKKYGQILAHFYPGTVLTPLSKSNYPSYANK